MIADRIKLDHCELSCCQKELGIDTIDKRCNNRVGWWFQPEVGVEKDKVGRKSLSPILGIQICMSIVDWLAKYGI